MQETTSISGKPVTALSEPTYRLIGEDAVVTPVVSFIGNSNSGKTTLLEKIVAELKILGYRVAVIKHGAHGFDIDRPGKDTWRLATAGADIVAVSSPDRVAFIQKVDEELTLTQLRELLKGKVDLILVEGYKSSDNQKILVLDKQGETPLKYGGEIIATVSARHSNGEAPQFDSADIAAIVDLLVEQIFRQLG